jgi:SAM-dependent methyltransferase
VIHPRRLIAGVSVAAASAPLLTRAIRSSAYARRMHGPGLEFASFGRRIGFRLLSSQPKAALDLILSPVNIVRYWEFPFASQNLPWQPGTCLDVASPRLFSYFVASRLQPKSIRVINPDERDARLTADLADSLGLASITVEAVPVSVIADVRAAYDSIWSISVLEHIPGDGDGEAIDVLWDALRPGGRLIVTVPVDRAAWDEFREFDVYGLGVPTDGRGFFFQRWYDAATLKQRLLGRIDGADVRLHWFGEREPGRFAAYEDRWRTRGIDVIVDDPREVADHYRTYPDWESMPGQGVAGIVIRKAAQ